MPLMPIDNEVLDKICRVLGVATFNRPHALLMDQGDFGTVFTYIPLFKKEYSQLPPELQKHVYLVGKSRYGLVAFVPKSFEIAKEDSITSITEVYDDYGNLREISYILSSNTGCVRKVENSLRREMLQSYAKKKKVPIKKIIRSRT